MSDELKTPLTIKEHNWQHTSLYDAEGVPLFRSDLEDWGVNEDNQSELEDKMGRVARAIVHRVNCHDKLVDALEAAMRIKALWMPYYTWNEEDESEARALFSMHYKIRSALELAKGGGHD